MITNEFGTWEQDIRLFCDAHKLSFDKARSMHKCWGIDFLKLKAGKGATDPVALIVSRNSDGSARCEQTEHTAKYLAQ